MNEKFSALEIANFYVQLVNSLPGESIDNLKLNKLLYYAQGTSLSRTGKQIFEDEIQAWDFGPVLPSVYHAYKCCGDRAIEEPCDAFDENRLSSEELDALVDVFMNYGRYTGIALKNMTHEPGSPWSQVYEKGENNVISKEQIKSYFDQEGEIKSMELNCSEENVIKAVPKNWDGDEDNVYDSI